MLDQLGSSNARKFTGAQANFPNYQALSWNGYPIQFEGPVLKVGSHNICSVLGTGRAQFSLMLVTRNDNKNVIICKMLVDLYARYLHVLKSNLGPRTKARRSSNI